MSVMGAAGVGRDVGRPVGAARKGQACRAGSMGEGMECHFGSAGYVQSSREGRVPAQGSECRDWVARLRGGSECRVGPDSGGLGLSAMAGRVGEGMSARKMGPG